MKLLIIEPDPVMGPQLARWFLAAGYHCKITTNAQDGIEAVEKYAPDAIVLELALPYHNGIEFLYELRSYAEWQHIPVIVCTIQQLQAPHLLSELGVKEYFYKPKTSLKTLLSGLVQYAPATV